jgi:hypothetical protein
MYSELTLKAPHARVEMLILIDVTVLSLVANNHPSFTAHTDEVLRGIADQRKSVVTVYCNKSTT